MYMHPISMWICPQLFHPICEDNQVPVSKTIKSTCVWNTSSCPYRKKIPAAIFFVIWNYSHVISWNEKNQTTLHDLWVSSKWMPFYHIYTWYMKNYKFRNYCDIYYSIFEELTKFLDYFTISGKYAFQYRYHIHVSECELLLLK